MGGSDEHAVDRLRRVRPTVLVASLAFHGLLVTLLVMSLRPTPAINAAAPINIFLFKPDRVPHHQAPTSQSTPKNPIAPPMTSDVRAERPKILAPMPTVGGGSPPQASEGIPDQAVRNALQGLLGCQPGYTGPLDEKTKLNCEKKLITAGKTTSPIDPIPSEKREYYDAVVATREAQRRNPLLAEIPKPFEYVPAPNPVRNGHGHNIGIGYHCTIKFGPGAAEANKAAGVQLGFPPCPIHLPKGSSLQEVDPALLPPK